MLSLYIAIYACGGYVRGKVRKRKGISKKGHAIIELKTQGKEKRLCLASNSPNPTLPF